MDESREIRTMRYMAWARAKGELNSMLETYWDDTDKYDALKDEIEKFTKHVESLGIQE